MCSGRSHHRPSSATSSIYFHVHVFFLPRLTCYGAQGHRSFVPSIAVRSFFLNKAFLHMWLWLQNKDRWADMACFPVHFYRILVAEDEEVGI